MADYRVVARQKAQKYGVDPRVFERQIDAESGFNPHAQSGAGAKGIAQFIDSTAKQYGVNVNDPVSSLDGAARLMRDALKKSGGDYKKALSIYNSGRPDGYLKFAETKNYVAKILNGVTPQATAPRAEPARSAASGTPAIPGTAPSASGVPMTPGGLTRPQILQQYLTQRGRPGALLGLAQGLGDLQAPAAGAALTAAAPASSGSGSSAGSIVGATGPMAKGVANFEGTKVAAWIQPALAYARAHGWQGKVNSGYRSFADQTRIYNSGVRPAARPGTSNHEGTDFPRGAVDVSDAPQLASILAKSPYASKLKWAGAKDPVHFSHPHGGSY